MRFLSLSFALFMALAVPAMATASDTESEFALALRAYSAGDFAQAAHMVEDVLQSDPACARCAHLLGRSYGRLAEKAEWLQAIALARKTRSALEQAVALDPTDQHALADLIKFYRAAPGFLGGSVAKARALERRLQGAKSDHTS